jgi:large subunit ribosomal protein L15e
MSFYKHMRELWKQPKEELSEVIRQRLVSWRREPATFRIDYPTRLDRARSLGYKAKPGIFMVRQRVQRGGRMRPKPSGGRRPKRYTRRKNVDMTFQMVAEQRANKSYNNCEVLNSYWVAEDGEYIWYEVILVDRNHPAIKADKNLCWITTPANKCRVLRGLTSAAKRTRGLYNKGKGAEKIRPSLRANHM